MSPSAPIVACAVCFGVADGPMLDAARLGVLVMAGFTTAMLVAFGLFFARIARRARASGLEEGVR